MRANTTVLWVLSGFFALSGVAYTLWTVVIDRHIEWVGLLCIFLAAVMAAFLAFYIGRSHGAQGGELPEDRQDANIDDGDPELGFFSPYSWWPITLGASAALAMLGVAVGFWIVFIAVGIGLVGLVGWVYEYYRGNFAR